LSPRRNICPPPRSQPNKTRRGCGMSRSEGDGETPVHRHVLVHPSTVTTQDPINVGELLGPIARCKGEQRRCPQRDDHVDGFGPARSTRPRQHGQCNYQSAPGGTVRAPDRGSRCPYRDGHRFAAGSTAPPATVVTFTNDPVRGYVESCPSQGPRRGCARTGKRSRSRSTGRWVLQQVT